MKTISINGKDYIEKETIAGQYDCDNCAFHNKDICSDVMDKARQVFGGDCAERNVFYGVADWSHQLKALGNGQVPLQAALAWKLLS